MIRNQKGMTAVELMMAMGASTAIAYVIFSATQFSLTTFNTDNLKMNIQTSAREGLYRMVQEIRNSAPSKITISNGGATIQFTVPDTTTPVTATYATNWGHQIRYAVGTGTNSTNIIRTDMTTNQTTVMATDVSGITFTGNAASPTVVTVALSVQRTLASGRTIPNTPLQLTGQARIRNT